MSELEPERPVQLAQPVLPALRAVSVGILLLGSKAAAAPGALKNH